MRTGTPCGRPLTVSRVLSKSFAPLGSVYCRKPASGEAYWVTSKGGTRAERKTVRSAPSAPGSRGPTKKPPTVATASSAAVVTARVVRPAPFCRAGRLRLLRNAVQPMATRAKTAPWSSTAAGVSVPSTIEATRSSTGATSARTAPAPAARDSIGQRGADEPEEERQGHVGALGVDGGERRQQLLPAGDRHVHERRERLPRRDEARDEVLANRDGPSEQEVGRRDGEQRDDAVGPERRGDVGDEQADDEAGESDPEPAEAEEGRAEADEGERRRAPAVKPASTRWGTVGRSRTSWARRRSPADGGLTSADGGGAGIEPMEPAGPGDIGELIGPPLRREACGGPRARRA